EAEHLGGRKIDDKLESGRLLDRNIAGLRTAQNLVDQLGGAPELIRDVWAVGHETARLNKRAGIEDRRQSRAERKRHDASKVGVNECIADNVKCVRLCLERLERTLRSEEHTSELQSRGHLVCRLLLEKKKKQQTQVA